MTRALVLAISETIREGREVPEGPLYAQLVEQCTLAEFTAIIDLLVKLHYVARRHHQLTWIGPFAGEQA